MSDTAAAIEAAYLRATYSWRNRLARFGWGLVQGTLFRLSPRPLHGWRRWLLRCAGATVGRDCHVYPAARIWAPWNLRLGDVVAIADDVEIYNPAAVTIGSYATISQGAFLCGATHDYRRASFPTVARPITIETQAWIAARAIVVPGVRVGPGCVVGAGSVVTRDLPAWTVCAGNPCRVLKTYDKSCDRS
jgi:putative colanic acid biosynthesis acetyltransferase WcaF